MVLRLLQKKNYLAMIENLVRGPCYLFRNLYAEIDGKVVDIAQDGHNACAIMASHILFHFKLISDLKAVVESLEKELKRCGWYEIKDPREGAVIIWEPKLGLDGQMHRHIGFYIGNNMAISNDSRDTGLPWKHNYLYKDTNGNAPKIEKIYWHSFLD